jgi:hypothetical protein
MGKKITIDKKEYELYKKIGRKYLNLAESFFVNIKDYPYDVKYIKKLIDKAEKDIKAGKLIKAKNIDEALKVMKIPSIPY